jgi:electron transport complex protein RnfG
MLDRHTIASEIGRRLGRLMDLREAHRKTPAYLAVLLGLFSLVGAGLLTTAQQMTSEAIAARQKDDLLTSLALVMPRSLYDNDPVGESYGLSDAAGAAHAIYPARSRGRIVANAWQVTGQGYGGSIDILLGVAADGSLLGVRVLHHAETPGLGDKIDAGKTKWVLSFDGLSFARLPREQWAVKKDGGHFDQFSGATITPRAVVKAVKEGLEFFEANKARLLAPAPASGGTS